MYSVFAFFSAVSGLRILFFLSMLGEGGTGSDAQRGEIVMWSSEA